MQPATLKTCHRPQPRPSGGSSELPTRYRLVALGALVLVTWLFSAPRVVALDSSLVQYEPSPVREELGQEHLMRLTAETNRNRFRVRMALPPAATAPMPKPGATSRAQANAAIDPGASPGQMFFYTGLGACSAYLCFRGLSSRSRTKSRTLKGVSTEGAVDEEAFGTFLSKFKAGPDSPPVSSSSGHAPEPTEGAAKPGKKDESLKPFFASTPEQFLAMWTMLQQIQSESHETERQILLHHLAELFSSLKYAASIPELLPVWQVCAVTEGLVQQLAQRPAEVAAHRLACVSQGLELLIELYQPGLPADLSTSPPIRLLAVDDDLISRQAVASALKKVFNQPDLAANGEAALAQISSIHYDVIFLDILMPGLDGFELYSRIKQVGANSQTPVVFVTSQSDLDTREHAQLQGATGLIAKPFLAFEITLTALTLALRHRLQKRNELRRSDQSNASDWHQPVAAGA